jgi:hypothetical protein
MAFPRSPRERPDGFGLIHLGVHLDGCDARERSQTTQECIRGPGF